MKSEKVAIYTRVSTADKGQDPELQLKDLRAYANAREESEPKDNAKSKGKRLGRRPLIDKKLLGTARDMKGRGMSIRGISKELGLSKSLVHKTLQI